MRMEKRSRKPKLSSKECRQSVLKFFQKKQKYEAITTQFNEIKQQFYDDMEDYFQANGIDKLSFESEEFDDASMTVTKVQTTSIKFNPDKLEKAIGSEYAKQVIHKSYEITDMNALIVYLKECGVDPKIFKSFITVSKKVDAKALDNLEELGKIEAKQIKGCYSVSVGSPYFKIAVGKGQSNDRE